MKKLKYLLVFSSLMLLLAGCGDKEELETQDSVSSEDLAQEELTEDDKEVIEEVSKEDSIEETTITRDENSVVLRIEFEKGTTEEEQAELASKYMERMGEQYPDKNVNVSYSVAE